MSSEEFYCAVCNTYTANHPTYDHMKVTEVVKGQEDLFDEIVDRDKRREALRKDLTSALNRNSAEHDSGTPDYILADMLISHLETFNAANLARAKWRRESIELPVLQGD